MRIKLKRHKGQWFSALYRGNGGVSSMVVSRIGGLRQALGIFTVSNVKKALAVLPVTYNINVNGEEVVFSGDCISYQDVLNITGKSGAVSVVVTYPASEDGGRGQYRILFPGTSIAARVGMVVTARYTGNA